MPLAMFGKLANQTWPMTSLAASASLPNPDSGLKTRSVGDAALQHACGDGFAATRKMTGRKGA